VYVQNIGSTLSHVEAPTLGSVVAALIKDSPDCAALKRGQAKMAASAAAVPSMPPVPPVHSRVPPVLPPGPSSPPALSAESIAAIQKQLDEVVRRTAQACAQPPPRPATASAQPPAHPRPKDSAGKDKKKKKGGKKDKE
jgi:hypothetical protein